MWQSIPACRIKCQSFSNVLSYPTDVLCDIWWVSFNVGSPHSMWTIFQAPVLNDDRSSFQTVILAWLLYATKSLSLFEITTDSSTLDSTLYPVASTTHWIMETRCCLFLLKIWAFVYLLVELHTPVRAALNSWLQSILLLLCMLGFDNFPILFS